MIEWVKEFDQAHLLSDEHASDDESVHTQEHVQNVTQPWVVQHHGPWGSRFQWSPCLQGNTTVDPLHTFQFKRQIMQQKYIQRKTP